MPFSTYLSEQMGSATLQQSDPLVAGERAELVLTYRAGTFGVDDSGMVKISWRTASDMEKPQFSNPIASGYTTAEASNGAALECRFDRANIRPWTNTLIVRVVRGFLREGDTITVRMGDRRYGAPGIRMQSNAERRFPLMVFVDAFATYEFAEISGAPTLEIVAGAPAHWKAIVPSSALSGENFRLAVLAEDRWGNPTIPGPTRLHLRCQQPVTGLPEVVDLAGTSIVHTIEPLSFEGAGDIVIDVLDTGRQIGCRANPMRVGQRPDLRRYWGDLHGQSGETVGAGSIENYFAFARDLALIDIAEHQANDFQISDAYWDRINRTTRDFEVPGKFLAVPGYEWSGNTGLGGDRNVFYRNEGRPIHRSSHVLLSETEVSTDARPTARDLFAALADEDAVVIAHVGGRYADITYAHDARLETAVEIHSSWGTFEWLLHEAFSQGFRVGVICHSDDHKGRLGATSPGASSFGAIGGLTCYLMPELTRDALFEALRCRHHYGTTGVRIYLDVRGQFESPVEVEAGISTPSAMMGDIVRPRGQPMRLEVSTVGTAPIQQVDVFHGARLVQTFRAGQVGTRRRLAIRWEGAEYRGRGRETYWNGELHIEGNRFETASPVNFLNPEHTLNEISPGSGLSWRSVTTGNMAGIDLELAQPANGRISVETDIIKATVDLAALGEDPACFEAGGLDRRLCAFWLPEQYAPSHAAFSHMVSHESGDLPVYVRVTQEDCHRAWSSPIYLVD